VLLGKRIKKMLLQIFTAMMDNRNIVAMVIILLIIIINGEEYRME